MAGLRRPLIGLTLCGRDTSMEHDGQHLGYATPSREPSVPLGKFVRALGLLLLAGGIVYAALGTVGVDRGGQILLGCAIAGFGLLVALLGQILHAVETRR